jgi:competence protein ComFC
MEKQTLWTEFIDLLLPRFNSTYSTYQSYLPENEWINIPEARLERSHIDEHLDDIIIAATYHNDYIEPLIERAKFFGETAISRDLAQFLSYRVLNDAPTPDLIIPVPPDPERLITRGYHLPSLLAQELAHKLATLCFELLTKRKSTPQQTKLSRKERLNNNKGLFRIDSEVLKNLPLQEDPIIWLVDDIITTGSTLGECAKTLQEHFPKSSIYGIVLAH